MTEHHIELDNLPEGHIIVGYVTSIKILDEEGNYYWSLRKRDLNDMEAFGMATDMANTIAKHLSELGQG